MLADKHTKNNTKSKTIIGSKLTFSSTCTEPEVLVDSSDGSLLKMCTNKIVPEWQSLALLGKLAMTDGNNKFNADYSKLHNTESLIGLKFADREKE